MLSDFTVFNIVLLEGETLNFKSLKLYANVSKF